jgi:hypothetical protein
MNPTGRQRCRCGGGGDDDDDDDNKTYLTNIIYAEWI